MDTQSKQVRGKFVTPQNFIDLKFEVLPISFCNAYIKRKYLIRSLKLLIYLILKYQTE